MTQTPYKIATLVFLENMEGSQLLLHRRQSPNKGLWIPVGGKLDTHSGESPVECALRETMEETKFRLESKDLHLFGYLSEENYEGSGHWLIFLFHCKKKIIQLPPPINEGVFAFHPIEKIPDLPIPASDREFLWPIYQSNRTGFTGVKIKYGNPKNPQDYHACIETQILGQKDK